VQDKNGSPSQPTNEGNFVIHNSNLIDGISDHNNGDLDETETTMDIGNCTKLILSFLHFLFLNVIHSADLLYKYKLKHLPIKFQLLVKQSHFLRLIETLI